MATETKTQFWAWNTESPDDDGQYCEVFERGGRTVYVTDVYLNPQDAQEAALGWAKAHDGMIQFLRPDAP